MIEKVCRHIKKEYRFCERRWRFDYACQICKIAIEVEGGVWTQGRHTRGSGYIQDMEKYNTGTLLGWKIFRFTPGQIKKYQFIPYVQKFCIQKYEKKMILRNPSSLYISKNLIDHLKKFEGLRLEKYKDAGGKDTIGYGHLIQPNENIPDHITAEEAEELLKKDVFYIYSRLVPILEEENILLTQSMFDAILSFVYNVGLSAFKKSTLFEKLKAGKYEEAAQEFERWVYVTGKDGKKRKLKGLERRRKAEKEMFLKDWDTDEKVFL